NRSGSRKRKGASIADEPSDPAIYRPARGANNGKAPPARPGTAACPRARARRGGAPSVLGRPAALVLARAGAALAREPAADRGRRGPGRAARLGPARAPRQLLEHALERPLAVAELRAALGGDAGDPARAV